MELDKSYLETLEAAGFDAPHITREGYASNKEEYVCCYGCYRFQILPRENYWNHINEEKQDYEWLIFSDDGSFPRKDERTELKSFDEVIPVLKEKYVKKYDEYSEKFRKMEELMKKYK